MNIQSKIKHDTSDVWKQVEIARHPKRPNAMDYIPLIFNNFIELHGDRLLGDDPAIVAGVGFIETRPVTIIANQKGHTLKEKVYRNFGMTNPEGIRKALRLAKDAEKFKRPIITFIDTVGAYPSIESEEHGIGEAIARNILEFSQLQTPIICVLIGEGFGGGALSLGIGDKIYMLENTIYSVISPERFATILLKNDSKNREAAIMLKITSKDLLKFNIINEIIPEPSGGAHNNLKLTANYIKEILLNNLNNICGIDSEILVRNRNQNFSKIGIWNESIL